jgi:hypothetical protein
MEKKIKPKKCKNCKELFQVVQFNQKYCFAPECLKVWVYEANLKDWNKRKPILKKSIETVTKVAIDVQKVFNSFIRLRDQGENCITCKKPCLKENAGHYFNSNNHWNVRFDERNVHLQCEYCNTHLHGNPIPYEINLKNKIGHENYVLLCQDAHKVRNFTINELYEIKAKYELKIKTLKNK